MRHQLVRLLILLALVGAPAARAASTDEQKQREEYIQRALQPPPDPALGGRRERSTGTGFYVSVHALLTNYHVIRDCPLVTVQTGEDDAQPIATVVATDQPHDLALLEAQVASRGIAEFEARPERADGSDLYIVGYPAHGMVVRQPTLTPAVATPANLATTGALFQLAADIHGGHSGSPVLDEYGAVLGVITAAVNTPAVYAKTGRLVTDLGVAISDHQVLEFLRDHKMSYQSAAPATSLTPTERLARAQAFVRQVICWQ